MSDRGPTWLRYDSGSRRYTVSLHVQPGARVSAIAGLHGEALKVKVAAPASDNRANAELIGLLAVELGVARSAIAIRRGASGRRKILEIAAGPELAARLARLA